jgi:hypothetical protein
MDDNADMPPPGPKQLPPRSVDGGTAPPTGSTATNGHWLHDAAGPSVLVGGISGSVSRLQGILSAKRPGLRCSVDGGALCIEGVVDTQAEAREIRQLVQELEPGVPVVTRLAERQRGQDG